MALQIKTDATSKFGYTKTQGIFSLVLELKDLEPVVMPSS